MRTNLLSAALFTVASLFVTTLASADEEPKASEPEQVHVEASEPEAPAPEPSTSPLPTTPPALSAAAPPAVAPSSPAAPMPVPVFLVPSPNAKDKPSAPEAAKTNEVDDGWGLVGTLSFSRPMILGSSGSDVETNCASLGTSCSSKGENGGGLTFSVGYNWKYLGFDILNGVSLDGATRSFSDAAGSKHSYSMARLGGFAAVRLRGQVETDWARATLAAGPGASYRVIGVSRQYMDIPEDGDYYGSLAFTADAAISFRASKTAAITVGAMLWMENANNVKTHDSLGAKGAPDRRDIVSGLQTTVLPYVGLQFGR